MSDLRAKERHLSNCLNEKSLLLLFTAISPEVEVKYRWRSYLSLKNNAMLKESDSPWPARNEGEDYERKTRKCWRLSKNDDDDVEILSSLFASVCPMRWDWRMCARARCVRLSNFTIWRHRWRYFYRIESKWKREIVGRLWFYYMSILSRNETREGERQKNRKRLWLFFLWCDKTNWSKDDREGWDANDNRSNSKRSTPEAQRREEHEREKEDEEEEEGKTRRRWSWWSSSSLCFSFLFSCGFSSGNESRPSIIEVTFKFRARERENFSFSRTRGDKNNTVNRLGMRYFRSVTDIRKNRWCRWHWHLSMSSTELWCVIIVVVVVCLPFLFSDVFPLLDHH